MAASQPEAWEAEHPKWEQATSEKVVPFRQDEMVPRRLKLSERLLSMGSTPLSKIMKDEYPDGYDRCEFGGMTWWIRRSSPMRSFLEELMRADHEMGEGDSEHSPMGKGDREDDDLP